MSQFRVGSYITIKLSDSFPLSHITPGKPYKIVSIDWNSPSEIAWININADDGTEDGYVKDICKPYVLSNKDLQELKSVAI